MKTSMLDYNLPDELIAQKPADIWRMSRLLVLNRSTHEILDRNFEQITDFLKAGDCLVINDTKVLPARFFAKRPSGANLEALFLEEKSPQTWLIMLKGLRKTKTGEKIILQPRKPADDIEATILEKSAEGKCVIKVDSPEPLEQILEKIGYPPLPPYIKRGRDEETANEDLLRYQTVFANTPGAVAAPTAGLHFTTELMRKIEYMGVKFATVTLHVGAGTFKPVTTENLEDHPIHSERYSLDAKNAEIINETRKAAGRIIAVGTTSVRTLETIAENGSVLPKSGSTSLFLTPGCKFQIVDAIITNFHLPKSTLLALVAAFAGLDEIMAAYRHAIEKKYRFFSYGDAMLIV